MLKHNREYYCTWGPGSPLSPLAPAAPGPPLIKKQHILFKYAKAYLN